MLALQTFWRERECSRGPESRFDALQAGSLQRSNFKPMLHQRRKPRQLPGGADGAHGGMMLFYRPAEMASATRHKKKCRSAYDAAASG